MGGAPDPSSGLGLLLASIYCCSTRSSTLSNIQVAATDGLRSYRATSYTCLTDISLFLYSKHRNAGMMLPAVKILYKRIMSHLQPTPSTAGSGNKMTAACYSATCRTKDDLHFLYKGWGGGWDRYHQPSRNKTLVLCYTRFVITTLYCYTRKILPSLQENKVLVLRRSRHSLLPTVKILCKSCPIYSPRDGWQLAAAIKWLFCILPSYDYKISKKWPC